MSKHYISERSLQRIAEKRAERSAGSAGISRNKSTYEKGHGVIYIIGNVDHSTPYKIGFTSRKDTTKRLEEIQAGSWVELKLLYESPVLNNITQIEKRVHGHYNKKRIKNEWFALTKKDVAKLKNQLNNGDFTDEKYYSEEVIMRLILGIE